MTLEPDDTAELTELGEGATRPRRKLETFPNHHADRDYIVELDTEEFTCLCPVTGQPEFAEIRVSYVPGETLIELKSLKLYIQAYRSVGIHHESGVNKILDDLVNACAPQKMEVVGDFSVRGGIKTVVRTAYESRE